MQKTRKIPENTPLHSETGYIRIFPTQENTKEGKIEFVLAQPFGVCEIEEGTFKDNTLYVQTQPQKIIRTETAKPAFVRELRREFVLSEEEGGV